ncbi:MAG: hypothetical protein RLZZ28_1160, partial [Bacteroidota bacterium]
TPAYRQYWNHTYRLEATVQLEELLETTMHKETFEKIQQPVLVLNYYKDETHQDKVVKIAAMKEMFSKINTAPDKKKMVAIPEAGNHVLASPIQSKDIVSVEKESAAFLKEILKMPAIK